MDFEAKLDQVLKQIFNEADDFDQVIKGSVRKLNRTRKCNPSFRILTLRHLNHIVVFSSLPEEFTTLLKETLEELDD